MISSCEFGASPCAFANSVSGPSKHRHCSIQAVAIAMQETQIDTAALHDHALKALFGVQGFLEITRKPSG